MLLRAWRRLPAIIRGIIVGELVVTIGVTPPELFLVANLRVSPAVPWMLAATALWLWFYWRFLDGAGRRRELLRATPVSGAMWRAVLLFGALALTGCLCLAFLTATATHTAASAFQLPIKFEQYPWWTIASCIAVLSITAGVIEEAGFRGYMLTAIQERHGWMIATLVTGFMFFADHHFSHAYATLAYLPFFMIISAAHALMVRATGSIKPSIVLHSMFDLAVVPVMFGIVARMPVGLSGAAYRGTVAIEAGGLLVAAMASLAAYRHLQSVARTT